MFVGGIGYLCLELDIDFMPDKPTCYIACQSAVKDSGQHDPFTIHFCVDSDLISVVISVTGRKFGVLI